MSQPIAGQPGFLLPTEAYTLGAAPLGVYQGRTIGRFVGAFAVLVLGAIVIIGALFLVTEPDSLVIGCIAGALGIAFLGGGVWSAYRAFVERDLRVILMPDGFVLTRGGQHHTFRWDNIAAVWQAITVHKRYGMTVNTTYNYTIQRNDNFRISLNNNIKGIEQLGQQIQSSVTKTMLPKAIETLKAGGTLNYGKVQVTAQGLSNGKELIPWNQVKSVQVHQGQVTIRKEGKWLSWAGMQVAAMPNVFVFIALVDSIVGINRR